MQHTFLMPHGWCMTWDPWLIGLNVVTDAAVALSYYSIPAALFYIVLRKKITLSLQPILVLFGLFIALCGGGHLIDIVSIWKPIYWTKGYWNLFTAAASVMTAIVLIPRAVDFIRMPETAERLRRESSQWREQHSLLRAVLDSVDEGIVLIGRDGVMTMENARAVEILRGRSIGAEWADAAKNPSDIWNSPDGRIVERFTKTAPGYGQVYVLRDITARQHAERARLRLERIVSSMKQGFAIISLENQKILQSNASFDAMHGIEAPGATGMPAHSIYAGTPAEQKATFAAIRELCEQHGSWQGETRNLRGGAAFFCDSRIQVHGENGQRLLASTHWDLTEQKKLEEESGKLQARLVESAKLESLGVLAGGVAHDFNNLLTGILGNLSLALEFTPQDEKGKEFLGGALQATETAAKLTNQLLAYSGKGRFLLEPVNLATMSSTIGRLVNLSIPKHVTLHFAPNPDLPTVIADGGQLEQLVMNLIINAAEAIGEAPGEVRVDTGVQTFMAEELQHRFPGQVLAPGEYVWISVSDNGCGMSPETLHQIFDPFFTTKFTGRGLGLAAALGIVRGHRGALEVESSPGAGSTFRVFLPVHGEAPREMSGPQATEDLHGSGTILVVDDDEVVRRFATNALRQFGYRVLAAANGLEALQLFQSNPGVTLVLLDVAMPIMGGEETMRRLMKLDANVPIVLTTGYSESEASERFGGTPVAGFLQKPFASRTLAEKVRRHAAPVHVI